MAAPGYAPKGGGSFSGGGGGYKVVNGMIVQPSAPPAPTGGGGGGKPSSHGSFLGQLAKGLSAPVWGGEALGIVPHSVAHAVYGLNAGLLGVAVHPILTAKQFGVPLKGLVEAPYAVAKDFEHQIGKGQIPLPLQALTDPVGTTLGLGYIGARHPVATQQAAVSKAKAVERVGGHLVKAQIQDIKNLYGPHWEYYANHEPLNNFLNVTSLAGGVTRGVALEAAAARLAAEGDIASSRLAVALKEPGTLWKESGNFGIRRTSYTTPEGTTMHFDQPYSHSPLMAYTQMTLQGISERYPNMRVFGAMPRVTRATANQIRRNVDRFLTSVPGMESVGALNKGERQRLYWGGQLGDYSATGLQRVRHAHRHLGEAVPERRPGVRRADEQGEAGGLRSLPDQEHRSGDQGGAEEPGDPGGEQVRPGDHGDAPHERRERGGAAQLGRVRAHQQRHPPASRQPPAHSGEHADDAERGSRDGAAAPGCAPEGARRPPGRDGEAQQDDGRPQADLRRSSQPAQGRGRLPPRLEAPDAHR